MTSLHDFSLSDLFRRVQNLVRVGVIAEVDLPNKVLRVQTGNLLTGWLPIPGEVTQNYIRWRPLKPGTQVILLCESGDPANAVISQILYTHDNPPPSTSETLDIMQFVDGTVLSYDTQSSTLTADIAPGGTINASADEGVINIQSNQGAINATAHEGTIDVHADNGEVTVSAVNGTVDISANNGTLKAIADNGTVTISADNGEVDVSANQGVINLDTQAGAINATCLSGFTILGDVTVIGGIECSNNVVAGQNVLAGVSVVAAALVRDGVRSMAEDRLLYNTHVHANNGAAPPVPLK